MTSGHGRLFGRPAVPGSATSGRGRREHGMVTAELAVALPALVLAALFALTAVQVLLAQLRALDAADLAARLAARGEPGPVVSSAADRACPQARLHLRVSDGTVVAEAQVTVAPAGIGVLLPAFVVREHATYALEDVPP